MERLVRALLCVLYYFETHVDLYFYLLQSQMCCLQKDREVRINTVALVV
jgi:hypothetical protein